MKCIFFTRFICLLAVFFLIFQRSGAQNWDINFVKKANPAGAKSVVFRGFSSSVYPISFLVPAVSFIAGEAGKNGQLKRDAYDALGAVAIAAVATEGIKIIVDRKRPYESYTGVYPYEYEAGKSLPSAHASLAFATATTLSLQYKKWYVVVPAYAWAATCGYSRIYLGEHYPSDVLAGAAVGAGSALLSHWLTKKFFTKEAVKK